MALKIKFLFLVNLFCWQTIFAQDDALSVIDLPINTYKNLIGKQLYYYENKTNKLSIEEISQLEFSAKFTRSYQDILNFSYSKSSFWLKIQVKDTEITKGNNKKIGDWIAVIDYPILDYINFYYQDQTGTWQTQRIGDMLPFKNRTLQHRFFAFPLVGLSEDAKTYYFKIDTESTANIPLSIQKVNDFYQNLIPLEIYYGIFIGIFLLVILNNLFLFFYLQEASYFWYVSYILANLLMNLFLSGHIFQYFFADLGGWQNQGMLACFTLTNILAPIYAIYFLDIHKFSPWFHRILMSLAVLATLTFFGVFFLTYRLITGLGQLNSLLTLITVLIIGGITWRAGNQSARFYIFGYWLYFFCVLPAILKNFISIPITFSLFMEHGTELGVLCEAVLLSIALADKTRLERRKAHREKEEAQQETIKVQKEANEKLEHKVEERTQQLQEANEELRASEEEIRQQAEELKSINENLNIAQNELQTAFNEIEQKNKDITSSITYASRIQSALLALDDEIQRIFPQNFILFRPRDVVSGDFYWFYEKDNKSIVIAIDCTGHGVPGAFMSMIADSLLNQIILEKEVLQADLILEEMNQSIRKALKQDITENRDGMDLALCILDKENHTLEYAGAHNPLIIIQNNELREIKGDPFGIGGYQGREGRSFTRHIININPQEVGETIFYLYSDGYQDQFGGPDKKKFFPRRFRELLFSIYQKPLLEQKNSLNQTIVEWMETEHQQINDILVIGIKI